MWSWSNFLTIEYLKKDLAARFGTIPSVHDENNKAFVAQRLMELLISTTSDGAADACFDV
jgi:hypothetical protein